MIPIYRAKKIDSDKYVKGCLVRADDYDADVDEDQVIYFIMEKMENYRTSEIWDFVQNSRIDPATLSIHFPDMIDNDKNKLFASLKVKKGASKVLIKFNEDFSNDCVTVDEGSFIECFIKFENGGLFFEEQDSTWYYLDDILNLDCEITEIGIEE